MGLSKQCAWLPCERTWVAVTTKLALELRAAMVGWLLCAHFCYGTMRASRVECAVRVVAACLFAYGCLFTCSLVVKSHFCRTLRFAVVAAVAPCFCTTWPSPILGCVLLLSTQQPMLTQQPRAGSSALSTAASIANTAALSCIVVSGTRAAAACWSFDSHPSAFPPCYVRVGIPPTHLSG